MNTTSSFHSSRTRGSSIVNGTTMCHWTNIVFHFINFHDCRFVYFVSWSTRKCKKEEKLSYETHSLYVSSTNRLSLRYIFVRKPSVRVHCSWIKRKHYGRTRCTSDRFLKYNFSLDFCWTVSFRRTLYIAAESIKIKFKRMDPFSPVTKWNKTKH